MSDTEDNIVDIDDDPEPEQELEAEEADGDADESDSEAAAPAAGKKSGPTKRVEVLRAPKKRMTPEILSLYEQTELISVRASMIARTGTYFGDYPGASNEIEIARRELAARKCPLSIEREVGRRVDGDTVYVYIERWDPNEMILTTQT